MTRDEYFDQLDVPYHVRVEQIAWEQRHTLLRLWRIKGMTLKQLIPIRQKMGCESRSVGRIQQICTRAAREEKSPGFKYGSPVERWLKQQVEARNLYNELQLVLDPKPKPKPKVPRNARAQGPRPPRRLPWSWSRTWHQLPKLVDLPPSVPLPPDWTNTHAQIQFIPMTDTTAFRLLCRTPQGECYCDLIIDHAWDGDTRPLFTQAIHAITKFARENA